MFSKNLPEGTANPQEPTPTTQSEDTKPGNNSSTAPDLSTKIYNFYSKNRPYKWNIYGYEILKFRPTRNKCHLSCSKGNDSHKPEPTREEFEVIFDKEKVLTHSINGSILEYSSSEIFLEARTRDDVLDEIDASEIGDSPRIGDRFEGSNASEKFDTSELNNSYEIRDTPKLLDIPANRDGSEVSDDFENKDRKPRRKYNYSSFEVPQIKIADKRLQNKAWRGEYDPTTHEDFLVSLKEDQRICEIKRTRYIRQDLSMLTGHAPYVTYKENPDFSLSKSYSHEFTRFESIPGKPVVRAGLCAYCEKLSFHDLKTSAYAIHMGTEHGIDTNGYLYPDPGYAGVYFIKNIQREGLVCPACMGLFKISTHIATRDRNRLYPYLLHFRINHRRKKNKKLFFDEFVDQSEPERGKGDMA